MKVAIVGTGYVGLSTGICLAEVGHQVTCIDVDEGKIALLKRGKSPIYEPGMEELLQKNLKKGNVHFTSSLQRGMKDAEIIMIAVGTPQKKDGSVDLYSVEQVASNIGASLENDAIIIIKSTVPVGTSDRVKGIIRSRCKDHVAFEMISNPEFLREGSAIQDTMEADRIVIGYEHPRAAERVKELYRPFHVPILLTSIRSAEMIKYAANAFLATKISFINLIANLCERVGADIEDVSKGIGMDKRIGPAFLQAGIGYGGSCFPKDVQALIHTGENCGVDFSLLKETVALNNRQQRLLVERAESVFSGLKGRKIAILGLSFKPNTDDMREAPSITIISTLLEKGAIVTAYDPVAAERAKNRFGDRITFADSVDDAVRGCDGVFLVTEWEEFLRLPWPSLLKSMGNPIIFDGRNCLKKEQIDACREIAYYPVGRPAVIKGVSKGSIHSF